MTKIGWQAISLCVGDTVDVATSVRGNDTVDVAFTTGVFVGGIGVLVGDTAIFVDGTDVSVGGIGVSVGGGVRVTVGLLIGPGVADGTSVGVDVLGDLDVAVGVVVVVAVGVVVAVSVGPGVAVGTGVTVLVAVGVLVELAVAVGINVGVAVEVAVDVAVAVSVGLGVGWAVSVGGGEAVDWRVTLIVLVGIDRLACVTVGTITSSGFGVSVGGTGLAVGVTRIGVTIATSVGMDMAIVVDGAVVVVKRDVLATDSVAVLEIVPYGTKVGAGVSELFTLGNTIGACAT